MEDRRIAAPQQAVVAARHPLAVDDRGAALPAVDETGDQGGRVLQIGVHQDDGVAGCISEAGRERDFLAEIAAERNCPEATVFRVKGAQSVKRAIGGAVIDEKDVPIDIDAGKHGAQALDQRIEAGFLVEHRNDDRNLLSGHWRQFPCISRGTRR
jgi:hypothetical protein